MKEPVLIWEKCLFHLVLLPHYSISVSKHPHTQAGMHFQHAHMLLQTCLMCSEWNTVWLVSPFPSSISNIKKVIWILAVVLLALRRMQNSKFIFKWTTITTLKLFSPCLLRDGEKVHIFEYISGLCNVKCINTWLKSNISKVYSILHIDSSQLFTHIINNTLHCVLGLKELSVKLTNHFFFLQIFFLELLESF